MKSSDVMHEERLSRVRALETEVTRLKAALAKALAEVESARAHMAEGVLAMRDASDLPPDGSLLLLDGFNILFNVHGRYSGHDADSSQRAGLEADVRAYLDSHPGVFAWIVFDGPRLSGDASSDGRLRVVYTGGNGGHRADRLMLDYLRACRFAGISAPARLVTNDVSFRNAARALGASTVSVTDFEKELGAPNS